MAGNEKEKPEISFTKYTPYLVAGLKSIKNSNGEELPMCSVTALCRCGSSGHKPFCDGTHSKIAFVGEKEPGRKKDRVVDYVGENITIHDNRGVCAHKGACTDNLPEVFKMRKKPWIDPNGASVKRIVETIEKCPSGALSYSIGSRHCPELEREPAIIVDKNGPLNLVGGIKIQDDMNSKPQSSEHCTLCRCGESKNKPFCDGVHHDINFNDEE